MDICFFLFPLSSFSHKSLNNKNIKRIGIKIGEKTNNTVPSKTIPVNNRVTPVINNAKNPQKIDSKKAVFLVLLFIVIFINSFY